MEIPTIDGDVLTITKEDTADKARDNYKTVNNQRIKMTDEEFTVKMNIESHIDEVAAGVKPDANMEDDKVNLIKSVYALDDFISIISKAAANDNLVIIDKQKAQTILTTVGVQPSEVSRLFELSKDSLSQKGINVKKNSIETDSKSRMLTREQSEALSDIRKQFLEVLDGAGANYRESGAVEGDVKFSNKRLTNGNGKGYNKNSTYDEFRTNGMQWAYNSKTQTGDIGYVFNPRKGNHCIFEATKTGEGFIVIKERTSAQWREEYESIKENESSLREYISEFASERGSGNNSSISREQGAERGAVRLSSEERLQSDEAGNLERDGQDNQKIQDGEVKNSLPINDFESLHRSKNEKNLILC